MPWDLNARFARLFAATDRVAPRLRVGSADAGLRARMKDVCNLRGAPVGISNHAVRVLLTGSRAHGLLCQASGRPCVDWLIHARPRSAPGGAININDPTPCGSFTTLEV